MSSLDTQIKDFQSALDKYYQYWYYNQFNLLVAFLIVSMQGISLCFLFTQHYQKSFNILYTSLVLSTAYLLTDFINGLVHMYMDNNTNYHSIAGPFIAAFHLHHKDKIYQSRHPLLIYYRESGFKFWLVFYLIILLCLQFKFDLNFYTYLLLTSIGIFSSFAEVSHYWCHNSTKKNYILSFLQKYYILLPKAHHKYHHIHDNKNYAFLNGLSDPLINLIAQYFYKGYKNHADKHVSAYKKLAHIK